MLGSVTLPLGGGLVTNVVRIELQGKEFMHEVGSVTVSGLDRRLASNDSPIAVSYGATGMFRGYIVGTSGGLRNAPTKLSVIGMTSTMRSGRQRSWSGTDAEIVKQVCSLSKLAVAAEPTTSRYPAVNQAGVSDWAFVVARAKNAGYVVYPRGPQVRFHSRSYELDRSPSSAVRIAGTAVISFTPDFSDTTSSGAPKATMAVSGVDASGLPIQGSVSPQTSTTRVAYDTTRVATSVAEAQAHAAAVTRANDWTFHARATVRGDSRLRVGSPVYFLDVPGDYEGYWVVQQATHVLVGSNYVTELVLGIDRLGRGYIPPPPARPVVLTDPIAPDVSLDDIRLQSIGSVFDPESTTPVTTSGDLFADFDPYNGVPADDSDVLWTVATKLPDIVVEEVDWQTLLTPALVTKVVVPPQAHLVASTAFGVGGFVQRFTGAALVASSQFGAPQTAVGGAALTATSSLSGRTNVAYPSTTRYPGAASYPATT